MEMTTTAHWLTQHEEGGFPVEKAALGSCDLSVLHIGGYWEWLVRQAGRDVEEGTARAAEPRASSLRIDGRPGLPGTYLELSMLVRGRTGDRLRPCS